MNFWLIKLRYGLAIHVDKVVAYKYVYFFIFRQNFLCMIYQEKNTRNKREITLFTGGESTGSFV